jgi:hypothetical protein
MGQSIDHARSRAPAAIGNAERALEREHEIPSFTAEPGQISRPLSSCSLVAATERVAGWTRDAALEVRTDPIGMSRASGMWRMNRQEMR